MPFTKECPGCGETYTSRRSDSKYCTRECFTKNNWLTARHCERCGVEYRPDARAQRFCSRSCSAIVSNSKWPKRLKKPVVPIKTRIEGWLNGEWDGCTKEGLSVTIRKYLLEQAGFRCTSPTCSTPGGWFGVNPVSGKSTLTVDHTDGNSQNNSPDNLKVLCPNCHSLTPTYGALNKGNGRKARYKSVVLV